VKFYDDKKPGRLLPDRESRQQKSGGNILLTFIFCENLNAEKSNFNKK
jgi:hypothetical protein